jgi:hypothetical protein
MKGGRLGIFVTAEAMSLPMAIEAERGVLTSLGKCFRMDTSLVFLRHLPVTLPARLRPQLGSRLHRVHPMTALTLDLRLRRRMDAAGKGL